MDLDEPWLRHRGQEDIRGGVEALDVAHLEHRPAVLGEPDEVVRLRQRDRHGLLHQHVLAGLEKGPDHAMVFDGGHRHRGRVHLPQHLVQSIEGPAFVKPGHLGGAGAIRVVDPDQARPGQVAVDPGVLPSEGADPDHPHPHQAQELDPVDQQRLPRLHRERARPRFAHGLQRARSHHRHVEAHVLPRLGYLDHRRAGPRDPARPPDHLVGPLHGLQGHRGPVLDHDRLPEVEPGQGPRHLAAVSDVLALVPRGTPAGHGSHLRQLILQEEGGGQQGDPFPGQGIDHAPDQAVRVLEGESAQDPQQLQVGDDVREDLPVLHLAGHHRLPGPPRPQGVDAAPELAEADPVDLVHCLGQLGGRLLADGHRHHPSPRPPRPRGHQEGEAPVARDQPQGRRPAALGCRHGSSATPRRRRRFRITPRAEDRMNSMICRTSGVAGPSLASRSRAAEVLSWLCRSRR